MTYCKANNAEIADSFGHSWVIETSGMRYLEGGLEPLAVRRGCVATWSAITMGDERLVVEVEGEEVI
jgi:hypothetical protein